MRPTFYWVWSNMEGVGRLTPSYMARLQGISCPECHIMRAPFPMNAELTPYCSSDYSHNLVKMVLAGAKNQAANGLNVPLNWVGTIDVGVMSQDLLEIVQPATPSRWRYGTLSIEGHGVLPGLATVHDPDPLTLRGTPYTHLVCGECGACSYISGYRCHVLANELNTDRIRGLGGSSQFAVTEDLAEAIRARFPGRRHGLRVSPLPIREKPIDGLPVTLPKTWEEYEDYERSQGREPVFPWRTWIPDPTLTIGQWDRQRIARYGMESVFERPTAQAMRRFLLLPWTRELLKQWPKEIQDELLRQDDC